MGQEEAGEGTVVVGEEVREVVVVLARMARVDVVKNLVYPWSC